MNEDTKTKSGAMKYKVGQILEKDGVEYIVTRCFNTESTTTNMYHVAPLGEMSIGLNKEFSELDLDYMTTKEPADLGGGNGGW